MAGNANATLLQQLAGQYQTPQNVGALQHSQYLAQALESLQDSAKQGVKTPTQLWTNLLADGLLNYGRHKSDQQLSGIVQGGMGAQQSVADSEMGLPTSPVPASALPQQPQGFLSRGASMLSHLLGGGSADTAPGAPAPVTPMQPALPTADQAPAPPAPMTAPTPVPVQTSPIAPVAATSPTPGGSYTPQDVDALTRMIAGEAANQGPEGMAAVAHVALTRLGKKWGGAQSLNDVVYAPKQFEGATRPDVRTLSPDSPTYQAAHQVAQGVLAGQIPDPTGGAVNFLNPQMQAHLGRNQPIWAPAGQGQRIGAHVFYGGHPGQEPWLDSLPGGAAPPPPPIQPFQVASNGPTPFPAQPSAAPVPGGGGAPPPAVAPPSAAGGGMPGQGVPTGPGPTAQEIALYRQLMGNPLTRQQGLAMAADIAKRHAAPIDTAKDEFWGPDNQLHSAHQLQDVQGGSPNAFVQRDPVTGELKLTANPAYGPVGANQHMDASGSISQSPITQQPTFRIPGVNGVFVKGPDGRPAKVGDDQYGPDQLFNLRKQVIESDAFKNYQSANDAYGAMVNAAKQGPGGMRAYALRDTFARLINPGAVARVGTIQAITDAQGLPANIKGWLMNLKGDGNVPPEIAQQILDVSQGFLASHYHGAQALNQSNVEYAKRHGVDPSDVTAPLGDLPQRFVLPAPAQAAPPPNPAAAQRAALEAEARRRGLIK